MIRGTTPTITFTLPFDTSDINKVWITFSQQEQEVFTLVRSDCKFYEDTIEVTLTQEQTLKLIPNTFVEIQIRILDYYDSAMASDVIVEPMDRILKEGVI